MYKVLGTVQDCLSAVKMAWSFVDCILVALGVNDDDVCACSLLGGVYQTDGRAEEEQPNT